MTRADIIQIIFGIGSKEMDSIKDLLRSNCDKSPNKCTDCEYNESESECNPSCPLFWTELLVEEGWEDCVENFRILYNTYRVGHKRGYLEGEKRQYELENEEKNYE